MTRRVVTTYTDDLTGEESSEINTYTILVNGAGVEIDLTPESHDTLMEALHPFLHANGARRVRSPQLGRTATPSASRTDAPAVRAWARRNEYGVSARGRIPRNVHDAYEKATESEK
ncbi:Lsr2 family protein [Streptomyces sp. NPDC051664]|uniref:Lsr2 family protein n=1 Tax=Streptomyces sp. NPDC051664 TaxID=3365668 RepID=UPI0037AAFB12